MPKAQCSTVGVVRAPSYSKAQLLGLLRPYLGSVTSLCMQIFDAGHISQVHEHPQVLMAPQPSVDPSLHAWSLPNVQEQDGIKRSDVTCTKVTGGYIRG